MTFRAFMSPKKNKKIRRYYNTNIISDFLQGISLVTSIVLTSNGTEERTYFRYFIGSTCGGIFETLVKNSQNPLLVHLPFSI